MQHPAIGRGWEGGNTDNAEEVYDGCSRMTGKVALAPAKRREECNCIVLCVQWRRNAAMDAAV